MTELSVDVLRTRLGVEATLSAGVEQQLEPSLAAAVELVGRWCGPLTPVVRTMTAPATNGSLVLPVRPVLQVTEVLDPSGRPWLSGWPGSDLEAGIIAVRSSRSGRWTVTAEVGWADTPGPLVEAAYIVAGWTWSTQYRGARQLFGDDGTVSLGGFAIPRQADQLMESYKIR